MLAIGQKFKKQEGSVLLAKDTRTNKPVYYVPDQDLPLQKVRGNPLHLVNEDDLLKMFKKYGLKKSEIAKLINFYKEPDELSFEIQDDWKMRLCFKKVEELMLNALKNIYLNPTAELEVHHDPKLLLGVAMIAASNSGKTWLASSICLRPEFDKIKIYVFTQNPKDPSITRLKSRGKYTVFVDLDQINSPLKLTRDVAAGSILLFDDIFEMKRGPNKHGFDRRKTIINLCNQVLTRGRHHKAKNGRATSAIICAHTFRNAHDSKILWNECAGGLYVFPSSSPHKIRDFLTKTIGIHKSDLEQIFKFSKGSRHICFRISGKPLFALWKTGIYLL